MMNNFKFVGFPVCFFERKSYMKRHKVQPIARPDTRRLDWVLIKNF